MEIINHIVMLDGQARIKAKPNLKAEMVARLYVDGDYAIEDVMAQYDLSASEVHSAIAYYYDNQTALDEDYNRITAEIRQNAMTLEKFKEKHAPDLSND